MKNRKQNYYAKILLFGEYSVISGSKALTIPYTHFKGELSFLNDSKYTDLNFAMKSNEHLKNYAAHINGLMQAGELEFDFNIRAFETDIQSGMYFESSIPQGYGVGSSGAVVAALYDRYVPHKRTKMNKLSNKQIIRLKQHFSQLESYFHGTSSGLDPLNCYIKQPILIRDKDNIELVEIPRKSFTGDEAIFLINSGTPGKTEPLVKIYMSRLQDEAYSNMIANEYIPLNNKCIRNLLDGSANNFFDNLSQLSDYQLKYLEPMIPESIQQIWETGNKTGDYSMKLCGSGGGGFILGFTQNWQQVNQDFAARDIELIPVYNQKLKKAIG